MSVSVLSSNIGALAAAAVLSANPPTVATVSVPSAASADTVTLSSTAQQIIAGAALALPAAPAPAANDPIAQAIAAVDDTTGTASVADQVQAYGQLLTFVEGPPGGQPDYDRPYTPDKAGAVVALMDSPFIQKAQGLLDQVQAASAGTNWYDGNAIANGLDRGLAFFNGLSTTDQQIVAGVTGLGEQALTGGSGGTPISTVADYVANQQAQAGLDRALQAVISTPANQSAIAGAIKADVAKGNYSVPGFFDNVDYVAGIATASGDQATLALTKLARPASTVEWTQQVQAYFAANGPPPAPVADTDAAIPSYISDIPTINIVGGTAYYEPLHNQPPPDASTVAAALTATWDTTGTVSTADKTNALLTLNHYFATATGIGAEVVSNFYSSPFQQQAEAAATSFYFSPAVLAAGTGSSGQTLLGQFNALSQTQQQLVFAGEGIHFSTTLDGYKAFLAQSDAQIAADKASSPVVSPTQAAVPTSSKAGNVVAKASAPANTPAAALARLTSKQPSFSDAGVALTLLLNAAKTAKEAKVRQALVTAAAKASSAA